MKKIYIIAEIGINHDGKTKNIIKLIRSAKEAGASAVKFQLYQAKTLASKNNKIKNYFYNGKRKETIYEMWKRLEIKKKQLKIIESTTKILGIDLIFSIFDIESLNLLKNIKYKFIKIASSDINDFFLIDKIKLLKKPIIISTGMASKKEIANLLNRLKRNKVFLLHCVSLYPCSLKYINLRRMEKLSKTFKKIIGFSDHTIGIEASLLAMTMNAKIIEKHFTLNKKMEGPDHKLSADQNDLKIICNFAKNLKLMKGSGNIYPSKKELEIKKIARKSIYAKNNIKINQKINLKNIELRRPESFLTTGDINKIIGKKSIKEIEAGESLKKEFFI